MVSQITSDLTSCLQAARLLPSQSSFFQQQLPHLLHLQRPCIDLLPLLVEQWELTGNPAKHLDQADPLHYLRSCQQRGARFLLDASHHFGPGFRQWLGWRMGWYPRGIPRGQLVGMASSRLGRQLDEKPRWFQSLRRYCHQLQPGKQILLTVAGTATYPYATRAATLFGLPCFQVTILDSNRWQQWGNHFWKSGLSQHDPRSWIAFISPSLSPPLLPASRTNIENTPCHDRALFAGSQQLWICQLRPHGNIQKLLDARDQSRWSNPSSIHYQPRATEPCPTIYPGSTGRIDAPPPTGPRYPADVQHIEETPLLHSPWNYLAHWTRRQDGPWPDQPRDQWLDALILEQPGRARSALASIARIAQQRRLIATNNSIRGRHQVVCFTASPLMQWDNLRTYRPHRGRWDFEPYGICVTREWLKERGTQPVIYGDDHDWNQLGEDQQPFFQHRFIRGSTGTRHGDWSIEKEWRHAGHLCLGNLAPRDAFLFVPNYQQALQLASASHWPVVYLESRGKPVSNGGIR